MSKHNFLFLNLGETQATQISQAIANKKAQIILEELKHGATTESKLSTKLSMPLSTVHYNIQQLVKAGLVIGDQYHYSQKGREVSHYRLTNKVIVISPQKTNQFEALVKTLTPVILVIAAGTGFVAYLSGKLSGGLSGAIVESAQSAATSDVAPTMIAKSAAIVATVAPTVTSAPMMVNSAAEYSTAVVNSEPNYAIIFLIGSLAIAAVSLLGFWLWNKYKN